MATGDTLITLTPLQYAEYTALRAKLADAERERDHWLKEFRDVVDAGVNTIRKAREERDRYRAALEQVYRMSDSVAIWAFIREVTKESEATDADK